MTQAQAIPGCVYSTDVKSWTLYWLGNTKPLGESLSKSSLARPDITNKLNILATNKQLAHFFSNILHRNITKHGILHI